MNAEPKMIVENLKTINEMSAFICYKNLNVENVNKLRKKVDKMIDIIESDKIDKLMKKGECYDREEI